MFYVSLLVLLEQYVLLSHFGYSKIIVNQGNVAVNKEKEVLVPIH